jgi:hypothetical protein
MTAEIGFLSHRIDQGQTQVGQDDFERDTWETRPGANIDKTDWKQLTQRQQAGERVKEMLAMDGLNLTDGGQVGMFIPVDKGIEPQSAVRLDAVPPTPEPPA